MTKYIMRLDDAASRMNVENWTKIELLLDEYRIKPLVGVIPQCEDQQMQIFQKDSCFWDKVLRWKQKGWTIALHGYNHVYCTEKGGINPVNDRSEFAGLSLEEQKKKIRLGVEIFRKHQIEPKVFFAPSHTFDENTIEALQQESSIRIISDTIANKPYSDYGMTFVPQQSGKVRKLPFQMVTFCYHPNVMKESDFDRLESFLNQNSNRFISFPMEETRRQMSVYDKMLRKLYFARR